MSEWVAGGLVLLLLPALFGLMWAGWRTRSRSQADVAEPRRFPPAPPVVPSAPTGAPPAPDPASGEPAEDVIRSQGLYVSTVRAGSRVQRVAAHGLGVRGRAELLADTAGVWLRRVGAPDVYVPGADLIAVGADGGQVGKWAVGHEVLVLRWRCGTAELDTGFRPDEYDRATELADRVRARVETGER